MPYSTYHILYVHVHLHVYHQEVHLLCPCQWKSVTVCTTTCKSKNLPLPRCSPWVLWVGVVQALVQWFHSLPAYRTHPCTINLHYYFVCTDTKHLKLWNNIIDVQFTMFKVSKSDDC